MSESQSKLEITPRIIDLGDRVIVLQHVVSAGRDAVHPFRPLGAASILVGVLLIGSEMVMNGAAAFALKSGGSLPLWLGFAAGGIGLFLTLYARRLLIIRTLDGARTTIPTESDEAAIGLVARIRQAMEAGAVPASSGPSPIIAIGAQPNNPVEHSSHRAGPSMSQPAGAAVYNGVQQRPAADAGLPQTQPGTRRAEGYTNGHAGRGISHSAGALDAPAAAETGIVGQRWAMPAQSAQLQQPAVREQASTSVVLSAGAARDEGPHDLASLIEHVQRADLQHKDALIDLLRVVEDFYRGRASREDAVAHWRSFADYVVQYLGDVDGLIAYTERFGRHMVGR